MLSGSSRRVVLRSERLVVTSWLPTDVEALHEVHSDPETMRYVRNGRPESYDEVQRLVARYIAEDAVHGWTKWRLTAVDGSLIGRAGFGGGPSERQLSYLVRRELWGKGFATEVAESLVTWHLAHAPGVPLRAIVEHGNDASIRVLDKSGFEETGPIDYEGIACRGFTHPLT